MKHTFILLTILMLMVACQQSQRLPRQLNTSLENHFDSVFLDINGTTASDLHSLMVVQDGKVIYEKYGIGCRADDLHILWSATKTFTAMAAGFAWQDSLLDLNARLIDYLNPEELPDSMSEELKQVTIYHLLTMASGWEADMITNRIRGCEQFNTIEEILNHPFRDVPGHQWRYNNIDSYMLGVVVARVTGRSLEDYLNEKLFTPLGISDYYYWKDSQGYNTAAFGLYLTTESLAKSGMLMLQKGKWNGKQLLSEKWLEMAMTPHTWQLRPDTTKTPTDWQSGYGFQMWMCRKPGVVRMDGQWGQYAIIVPDKNAVVAMTTICTDRNVQMEAFWKYIYPNL